MVDPSATPQQGDFGNCGGLDLQPQSLAAQGGMVQQEEQSTQWLTALGPLCGPWGQKTFVELQQQFVCASCSSNLVGHTVVNKQGQRVPGFKCSRCPTSVEKPYQLCEWCHKFWRNTSTPHPEACGHKVKDDVHEHSLHPVQQQDGWHCALCEREDGPHYTCPDSDCVFNLCNGCFEANQKKSRQTRAKSTPELKPRDGPDTQELLASIERQQQELDQQNAEFQQLRRLLQQAVIGTAAVERTEDFMDV
mmetsp:Transcript_11044/g.25783  ORF Transcript_11044/g.25783 Transcript_11044/m.25783 type:complete len:249 (+) Transcript_11044:2-748(+)